jgi:hypothetical protein
VHQQGLYKISLYARGKDATVEDFKLETLISFNSPITEHWTPLHQTPPYFPRSFIKLAISVALEAHKKETFFITKLQ